MTRMIASVSFYHNGSQVFEGLIHGGAASPRVVERVRGNLRLINYHLKIFNVNSQRNNGKHKINKRVYHSQSRC